MKMLERISTRTMNVSYYNSQQFGKKNKIQQSALTFLLVLFVAMQAYGQVSNYADLYCTGSDNACVKQTQIAQLYVATFNRAPGQPGLNYWVNSSFGIDLIAMSFFDQPETQTLYPEGNTDTEFVTAIYENLFNRAPAQAGLDYWTQALGDGMPRSVLIEAIQNGATGTDRLIIDNKTQVALYYANMGLDGSDFYLFDITDDSTTVDEAKDRIDELVALTEDTTYPIVDTGQATCYNADNALDTCPDSGESFFGQDSQYNGHQADYTDNQDGTITDNVTGLMWQQSPDTDNDGDIDADDKLTYDEALAGAGAFGLGGYTDWRLPTIKELFSLIDFCGVDPSGYESTDTSGLIPFINTDYFDFAYGDTDAGERIIDSQYASSNLYVDASAGGLLFGVNFADGRIKGYGLNMPWGEKTFFVTYVRGNSDYGQNDFSDNDDGTVTDAATKLMWSQNDSGKGLTWEAALAWVQTKNEENYLGYKDWRMPNVKELQSIVDYTRSPGTSGCAAIDPLFNTTAITNEADQNDYPYYWSSTTHANWSETGGAAGAYVAFGRAMGYMDGAWTDVHGAGAQRSDPKMGDPADYPTGNGPQGDAIRIYNYVRLVRDAGNTAESVSNLDTDFEVTDWTDETHGKSADPNFDEVFEDTAVKRLDFVITEELWQSMLDDMTELYGEFGGSNTGGFNREPTGVGGGTTEVLADVDDPIFVPAEVFYNGIQWYKVGVRFKGNSSLQSSWQSGILKLSFKLDFDEFEDDYPQIDNQRFYGFKKFSLKNNYEDQSFMREKVAAKVFENAGLAVSHTAFYTLYIDHGNGPEYFGLYTLVEEVDNTVIKTQFSDDDGNLYKPEDYGASFVNGTFNETDFEKKTNEDEENWSDIIALFKALHDGSRTLDPAAWRANLDAIFNTDVFLKYLAVNTVIQNWDTYGIMTQNYYLYNDPDNSKLTWIPWDMNEALQNGKMGGALALDFSNIQTGGWPLIEYLYADDVYKAKYDAYVEDTINLYFEEDQIRSIYATYSKLIEPYATSEIQGYSFLNNTGEFWRAVSELNQHLRSRVSAVADYLD